MTQSPSNGLGAGPGAAIFSVTNRNQKNPKGSLAARRRLANINGRPVPGLNTSSQSEFIANKAEELMQLKIQ